MTMLKTQYHLFLSIFMGVLLIPTDLLAQRYGGPGLSAGAAQASLVVGNVSIRFVIINAIKKALSFMALAAVVVIVLAGIMLVLSGGDESKKETAKKMILYTFIGLIIIVIARVLVVIIIDLL
ncbi:MAG: hypothetical protein O2904_04815 [bacterium]|nr:hypothetical protein [bacterium]